MKPRDLIKLGFEQGPAIGVALKLLPTVQKELGRRVIEDDLRAILKEPNAYKDHTHWAMLAEALIEQANRRQTFVERETPAPFQIWGEGLEAGAVDQIKIELGIDGAEDGGGVFEDVPVLHFAAR